MLDGWEVIHWSCVTLAVHHRLCWFIHLWAHGLRKGHGHPIYTSLGYHTEMLQWIQVCFRNEPDDVPVSPNQH